MRSSFLFSIVIFLGVFHANLFAANTRLFEKYSIICSDDNVIEGIERKVLILSNILREKIYKTNDDIFEVELESNTMYQILDYMKMLVRQQYLARHVLVNLVYSKAKNVLPEVIINLLDAASFLDIPILKEGFGLNAQWVYDERQPWPSETLGSMPIKEISSCPKSFSLVCDHDEKIENISLKVLKQSGSIAAMIKDLGDAINEITEIPVSCSIKDMEKILAFMDILADRSKLSMYLPSRCEKKYISDQDFEYSFISFVQRQVEQADIKRLYKIVYWLDIRLLEKAFYVKEDDGCEA